MPDDDDDDEGDVDDHRWKSEAGSASAGGFVVVCRLNETRDIHLHTWPASECGQSL